VRAELAAVEAETNGRAARDTVTDAQVDFAHRNRACGGKSYRDGHTGRSMVQSARTRTLLRVATTECP
jgi:hypothetical protein